MMSRLFIYACVLLVSSGCFLLPKKEGSEGTLGPWPGVLPPEAAATQTGANCSSQAGFDADSLFMEYHGEEFAFDDAGALVTVSDWAGGAYRWSDDSWEQLAPFQSDEIAGLDFLMNGDLIFADEGAGALVSMTPQGGIETVLGSINSPNSLAVRHTGQIFSTDYDAILRIDPDSGEWAEIVAFPGNDLDGLVFSPNGEYLYFNIDATGEIYRTKLDEDGRELDTELIEVLDLTSGYQELNGMAMDLCGNLYALRTDGRVSRLRADGTLERNFFTVEGSPYTTALHFGSGIGEWRADHLYIMDRNGVLTDVPVGIDGAPEPHL